VYGVIAYYLRHRKEIDDYIQGRREQAEKLRQEIEAKQPNRAELRAKLLARKAPGAMLAALGEHVFTSESCPNMPTQKPWAWHPCTMWGGDFFCPFRA
jgi:hypothetical protein